MDQSKDVDAEVNLPLITASPLQKPFVMSVIGQTPRCGFVIELLNR